MKKLDRWDIIFILSLIVMGAALALWVAGEDEPNPLSIVTEPKNPEYSTFKSVYIDGAYQCRGGFVDESFSASFYAKNWFDFRTSGIWAGMIVPEKWDDKSESWIVPTYTNKEGIVCNHSYFSDGFRNFQVNFQESGKWRFRMYKFLNGFCSYQIIGI